MTRRVWTTLAVIAGAVLCLAAQPPFGQSVRGYIKVDAPVVVLTNLRIIEGTGAPARTNQTVVLRGGNIESIGDAAPGKLPEGAVTLDLAGKSAIPGLVMVHEHLYYPTGPGVYGQLGESFVRLYLAGGVTTMRTGGNVNGFMDLRLKQAIDAGTRAGPAIDATAPYLNGPNTFSQMREMKGPSDARRQVAYWADEGATSFKAYMNIRRDELAAAIEETHKRGLKTPGTSARSLTAKRPISASTTWSTGFSPRPTSSRTSSLTSVPGRAADSRRLRLSTRTGRRSRPWSRSWSPGKLRSPRR